MRHVMLTTGVILLFLQGCASPSKVMKSWMGHHISELYQSWGPPTATTTDGRGGTIVSYYYDRYLGQIPGRAVSNPDGSVSYTAPRAMTYTAQRHFYVNADGFIYSWRWKGL